MFDCEHGPGATEARLNFIGNKQDSVLLAESLERAQEAWRSNHEATFALYWFNHNGRDLIGCDLADKHALKFLNTVVRSLGWGHIHAIGIRERCAVEFRRVGAKAIFIRLDFSSHRHGHQCSTMIRIVEGDNSRSSRSITSNFDGIFNSFRATVKEDGFLGEVARYDVHDFFC